MNPLYAALAKKKIMDGPRPSVELPTADLGPIKPGDRIVLMVAATVRSMNDMGLSQIWIDMVSRNGFEEEEPPTIYVKTQESHG